MINLINKAQSQLFSYDCCLLSEQWNTCDSLNNKWYCSRYDELMEIWGIIWG